MRQDAVVETASVGQDNVLEKGAIVSTRIEHDDLGVGDRLRKAGSERVVTVTYDRHGNILHHSGDPTSLTSYNFPDRALRIGDTWNGSTGEEGNAKPVPFHLDDIVKDHGRDIAVFSYVTPDQCHRKIWQDALTSEQIRYESTTTVPKKNGLHETIHVLAYKR